VSFGGHSLLRVSALISRSIFNSGKSAPGGLDFAQRMDRHGDTRYQFALHMRQRLTERAFEQGLDDLDRKIHHQHKLLSWVEDEETTTPKYPVRCTMQAPDGSVYEIEW
jgi:phenol 2-monooxygenase (NADPH)